MSQYSFPISRLRSLQDPNKTPLVLVACGSFSPITFLHLRMFEMARDDARFNTAFEVVAGYFSPVNDGYKKSGLISAKHRVEMCRMACAETSDWLDVDDWEGTREGYTPTAQVLDHFENQINEVRGGVSTILVDANGDSRTEMRQCRIMLLAGSDLIQTMSEPGLWADEDLHHILGNYGCYIIERSDGAIPQSLFKDSSVHSRNPLSLYRENIHMVQQLVRNDVSSTKIRLFLKKGMSVKYLIPGVVVEYITDEALYIDGPAKADTGSSEANTRSNTPDRMDIGRDEFGSTFAGSTPLTTPKPSTSRLPSHGRD